MRRSFIFLVLGVCFAQLHARTELVFAYEDREIFPIFLGKGKETPQENPGVAVEIVSQLENLVDVKVSFRRLPWKRCLSYLESGKVDAIDASFKPDRMKIGVYPMKRGKVDPEKRINATSYFLYKRKNTPLSWDGNRFGEMDRKIGVPLGYSVADLLRKKGARIDESGSNETNIQKLLAGRVTAIVMHENVADFILENNNWDVVKVSPPLQYKPYYLVLGRQFVKRHPALSRKIWDAIETIRKRDLKRLFKHYYSLPTP